MPRMRASNVRSVVLVSGRTVEPHKAEDEYLRKMSPEREAAAFGPQQRDKSRRRKT